MYGKILHGSSFGGLVNYVSDPRKSASLVAASDGVNLTNNQTITDCFIMQAALSSRTKKPVGHFVLAFSPHDASHLDDRILEQIANDYLQRMGYGDNQFAAFRHHDKEHPHLHLIVNRVNFKGKCTKDSHEKEKNVKVCKELTYKFGLYIATGKERVKERRLRSMDAIRYKMFHLVRESLSIANNWKEFENELAKAGIRIRFRYNTKINGIEGISFSIAKESVSSRMKHDVSFSGKQLDVSLTLAHICQKLGNPIAIVHEQARAMYEDAHWDWYDSHNGFEVQHIDEVFPDFDSRFRFQAQAQVREEPRIGGDYQAFGNYFFESQMQTANDICDAGNGALHVGLATLGATLFVPYQPAISAGGGQFTSKMGWGDDDKYKKRHYNRSRGFGRGSH